jgi:hypothetical protein
MAPSASGEVTAPAKQRRGRHDQADTTVGRQEPREGGEHCPI